MSCKRGCLGVCRCEHEFTICATAYAYNVIPIPAVLERGCPVEIESSRLEIICYCCPIKIIEEMDPIKTDQCDGTTLEFDWTDMQAVLDRLVPQLKAYDLSCAHCSYRYKLYANNQPFLAGILNIDWSFRP